MKTKKTDLRGFWLLVSSLLSGFNQISKVQSYYNRPVNSVRGFPGGSDCKESAWNADSLGQKDPLEKGMSTHSSILAWRIPWTEELGGLQSMGSQRVRHNWVTNTLGFPGGTSGKEPACQCRTHMRHRFNTWVGKILWRKVWQPTPVFLPGESHGQGAWWARVHRVTKSQTQVQQLSTHAQTVYIK